MTSTTTMNWSIGDPCIAIYAEDSQGYPATIKDIHSDNEGNSYALVEFEGYEEISTVWCEDLLPHAKVEDHSMDGNNNVSSDANLTLHPMNSMPDESDNANSHTKPLPSSPEPTTNGGGGILKISREIDSKLTLIDSLTNSKASLEALTHQYSRTESDFRSLEMKYDEQCIQLSEHIDQNKVLEKESEKSKSLYATENMELKNRLKEVEGVFKRVNLEKLNLEKRISELIRGSEEGVGAYKDRIQLLEFELNELRSLKDDGGTSEEAKHPNNNSMNTTISLDRDDSVDYMRSPIRGNNHPIISMSTESEQNINTLINGGPLKMGDFHIQPVLCYFPVFPNGAPSAATAPTQQQHQFLPQPQLNMSPSYTSPASRPLRRPLPTTELSFKYPNAQGRLRIISLEENGSNLLVKEIENPNTTPSRVNEIYDELKDHVASISKDKWGHKVIQSLILACSYTTNHGLIQDLWQSFSTIIESSYGVDTLVYSLQRMPSDESSSRMVKEPIIQHGLLALMLLEGGSKIIVAVLERLHPLYIAECVNKNVDQLAIDDQGGKVLAKALLSFPHDTILPSLRFILNHTSSIQEDSRESLSIFEALLEHHVTGGITSDQCIDRLLQSVDPSFKVVLNRFLNSTAKGSFNNI